MSENFKEEKFADTESASEKYDEGQDEEEYARIHSQNKKRLKALDAYINHLWRKRVFMSTCINIGLLVSALYNGELFIYSVILVCICHIVDKHIDFNIHTLYQAKDYVKNG